MRAGTEVTAVDREHRALRSKSKSTHQVHRRNAGFSRFAKSPYDSGLGRENRWWRRRELNPRPRAVKPGYYMLISPLDLVHFLPGERGMNVDQPLGFRRLRRDGSQTLSSP